MRSYRCVCGNTIFFDNSFCIACRRELGFCPACRNLVSLLPGDGDNFLCGNSACGAALTKCQNYSQHNVCNRCVLVAPGGPVMCDCCRFNETVPDLTVTGNWQRWNLLEAAKRRLFYDLDELGLPYGTTADGVQPPLTFDFKGDMTLEGDHLCSVGSEEKVMTGHDAGRITINIREADDAAREKLRVEFGEPQRTIIGHFRHEIGHYYWDMLVKNRREDEFRAVFGDHGQPPYDDALALYYKQGPPADWPQRFISRYATMHPWEDFAETWATYLDMISGLDTAQCVGFGGESDPVHADLDGMVKRYQELGLALNEVSRAMGLLNVVPEVFVPTVVEKLRFVHWLVQQGRAENGLLRQPAAVPAAAPPPVTVSSA